MVKVTYLNQQLTVSTDVGVGRWSNCFNANGIYLPINYYFGFSAATGQLADDHDIHGFQVRNLDVNAKSINNLNTYSPFFSPNTISGIMAKIDHTLKAYLDLPQSNQCPPVAPASQAPIDKRQIQCDVSDLNRELSIMKQDVSSIRPSIDEIIRTSKPFQTKLVQRKIPSM